MTSWPLMVTVWSWPGDACVRCVSRSSINSSVVSAADTQPQAQVAIQVGTMWLFSYSVRPSRIWISASRFSARLIRLELTAIVRDLFDQFVSLLLRLLPVERAGHGRALPDTGYS
jgi:hypothetical protein